MLNDDDFTDILTPIGQRIIHDTPRPAWSWQPERAALRVGIAATLATYLTVCVKIILIAYG